MLLLDEDRLADRRAAASGPLAPLADALLAELGPVGAALGFIPTEKARLSRAGGVCPRDGARLEFDPASPHRHRCPSCGGGFEDEAHYRWWIVSYHLWLAERAVHGALLGRLRGEDAAAELSRTILRRYAELYLRYPNSDNVLGPSRPFFSTYLESIWLLQLCVALDLLGDDADAALAGSVRDAVIAPSVELIASYNEGASNRQVWNTAAILAASRLLDRDADAERAVYAPAGLRDALEHALLPDGTWYEGENYHLFAHRGLWYGVTMAGQIGLQLPAALLDRFDDGFAAPFLTALPDLTLPSRRDSQYAISLRQWRFAEMCELGLARRDDPRLRAALRALYDGTLPRRGTGRWRSTAEVERNEPASGLSRADLGWRSLLHARPELPPLSGSVPPSVLLEGQGIGVLRRDEGRSYVALDYGHTGGGHGHPDRLNLLLVVGDRRWFDDLGTGSYVDRSLFWYRSTLSHNAPLIDGRSQQRVDGELLAWEDRGAAGWIDARATGCAPGVELRRTVVVMPTYLIDRLAWRADRSVTVDLPFHADLAIDGIDWQDRPLAGGTVPEDGFQFLTATQQGSGAPPSPLRLTATAGDARLDGWIAAPATCEWWRATAPGAPGHRDARFVLARMRGEAGTLTAIWSWDGSVAHAEPAVDGAMVVLADGERHTHALRAGGWSIAFENGAARSTVDLGGLRSPAAGPPRRRREIRTRLTTEAVPLVRGTEWWSDLAPAERHGRWSVELGEPNYVRSEATWHEAGAPRATISIAATAEMLLVEADVAKADPQFMAPGASNPYDNEPSDINSDGIQLYLIAPRSAGRALGGAWLLVPESGGVVRKTTIAGYPEPVPLDARWRSTATGYAVQCLLPRTALGGPTFQCDVIVNEIGGGRERRRGQLVMRDARGEFIYLRGDRRVPAPFLTFRIADG